jgi:hypothetical protein
VVAAEKEARRIGRDIGDDVCRWRLEGLDHELGGQDGRTAAGLPTRAAYDPS